MEKSEEECHQEHQDKWGANTENLQTNSKCGHSLHYGYVHVCVLVYWNSKLLLRILNIM